MTQIQIDPLVQPLCVGLIIHMTGSGEHVRRASRGYRNHFCAAVGGDDFAKLALMAGFGLVVAGQKINGGSCQYFHATKAGCEMAGISKAATKRACGEG